VLGVHGQASYLGDMDNHADGHYFPSDHEDHAVRRMELSKRSRIRIGIVHLHGISIFDPGDFRSILAAQVALVELLECTELLYFKAFV
jgi:hypothetical protein